MFINVRPLHENQNPVSRLADWLLHVGGARTASISSSLHVTMAVNLCCVLKTPIWTLHAGSHQAIMDGMDWLSLEWDEGPYYQTKRFDRYNAVIDEMLPTSRPTNATAPKSVWKRCAKRRWPTVRSPATTAAAGWPRISR
ncbi:glutamate--tRNA ligase family protein [Shigella flexneri]